MPTQSVAKANMGSQIKQKENLTWKINLLAAQLGGKSRISRANLAAKSLVKDGENSNVDEEAIKKQLLELKAQKINMKLFHVVKEIKKLMKKAKNNEVQRLVKKSKPAKSAQESNKKTEGKEDSKDTESKIDEELVLLKSMDLDLIATTATRNKISKNGTIKHSNILSLLEFPTDEAAKSSNEMSLEDAKLQHNIEARLLNFKPIKEEFSKLLEDIVKIIDAGSQIPEVATEATNDAEEDEMEVEEEEEQKVEKESVPSKRKTKSDSSDKAASTAKKPKASKQETDASSTFVSTLYSDSEEEEEQEKPKKKKKSSDENWVDENFDKYYGKEKKNRPSQRRRREMYEKLYGEEANHVKAQLEAEKIKEERKLARQMKKSASGGNNISLGKRRSNAPNPSQSAKAKAANTEQLHPSWEAKKQQKDLMALALSGKGGLGNKKIVFDDSD
ncbi:hypothetical protein INT44_003518 [Umbelopsis vinacea]|uniref:Bud22 domain-containing protein n=1 Tax=Umbelopsis vinacea TaxID=44442 RepID=A0A8H7PW09_9FUNG|nr:hypothetical protein INT44_003518 [Umbelopsis vinacea]